MSLLIKEERKKQGLTQAELAGIAGTGLRFISDLENGKKNLQFDKLLAVVTALGLGFELYKKRLDRQ